MCICHSLLKPPISSVKLPNFLVIFRFSTRKLSPNFLVIFRFSTRNLSLNFLVIFRFSTRKLSPNYLVIFRFSSRKLSPNFLVIFRFSTRKLSPNFLVIFRFSSMKLSPVEEFRNTLFLPYLGMPNVLKQCTLYKRQSRNNMEVWAQLSSRERNH